MGKASRRKAQIRAVDNRARMAIEEIVGSKNFVVRKNRTDVDKISQSLAALIEFEALKGMPQEDYQAALSFVVQAWNISLLDAEQRRLALRDLDEKGGGDDELRRKAIRQFEKTIAKKLALFPDDHRFVASAEMRFVDDRIFITASAIVDP